ncbi:hypothetical protein Tco_0363477 [Tanacetum coccineum]
MNSNIRALKTTTKNLQEKADQLTQTAITNSSERVKAKTKMGKKDMEDPVPRDLPIVQPYFPPTPFPGHPKKQKDNLYKTGKTVRIPKKFLQRKLRRMKGTWMMTVHITALDDDYVAPATSLILEKHLNKFGEEIYDITRVTEKADGNLVNDVKDLSDIIKTYDFETFI